MPIGLRNIDKYEKFTLICNSGNLSEEFNYLNQCSFFFFEKRGTNAPVANKKDLPTVFYFQNYLLRKIVQFLNRQICSDKV